MLFMEFFSWWYSRGFLELFNRSMRLTKSVWAKFSVSVLLRTLFEPWKRIVTEAGGSIQDKSRALVDNLVSRFVGFTIRIFAIVAAVILELLIIITSVVALVLWPFVPFLVPLSVIIGFAS